MDVTRNWGFKLDPKSLIPRRENVIIVSYVAILCLAVTKFIAEAGGPRIVLGDYLPNVRFYMIALVVYISGAASYMLIRYKPDEPTQFLLSSPQAMRLWRAIWSGLPLIIALGFFLPSFSLIKSGIPLFTEYSWDLDFIELDRTIHGTDPWRILQPVLGIPIITSVLAKLYHAWFLLIYAGSLFFAFAVEDRTLRYRYFFSYFVMWTIGGIFMAVGLASVGPCFLEPVLGNSYFAEQMAYLHSAHQQYPVDVLEVQTEMVAWFESGNYGLGRGISAMPSMHVALAFLFFLAMRHVSHWAGWFFGAFFVIIQLSSVHLAYHYAIDGYASIALVAAVWWIAGKLTPLLLSQESENDLAADDLSPVAQAA